MQDELYITRAAHGDLEAIYALYHSLIDMPYSTWDEEYPTREIVEGDILEHDVLVMKNGEGKIVSAIALWHEAEFMDAAPWYADVTRWAMLCRLGVDKAYQGRGIAKRMLSAAMEKAREDGCEAVQFLVSKENPIAQRAYASLGFDICGEAELFAPGEWWLCYQKRL